MPISTKPEFNTIAEAAEAFKRGEFIVVLDNDQRENEGDLLIACEDLTTEKMAFMVKYTRYTLPHKPQLNSDRRRRMYR